MRGGAERLALKRREEDRVLTVLAGFPSWATASEVSDLMGVPATVAGNILRRLRTQKLVVSRSIESGAITVWNLTADVEEANAA